MYHIPIHGAKFRSNDLKLDFKDVMIVPREKVLRGSVSIERIFSFRTKPKTLHWKGIPIISSNKVSVTSPHTFDILHTRNYISCFPTSFNEDWCKNPPMNILKHVDSYMLSCGSNNVESKTLCNLINILQDSQINVKFVCIDATNGYFVDLIDTIAEFRDKFSQITIVAGNVVTAEGTKDIIQAGANIVKCGNGCFTQDTKILTIRGDYKNICDLTEGEEIVNGKGFPTKVKRIIYKGKKHVLRLLTDVWMGETRLTRDHKYLVLDKDNISWKEIERCRKNNMLLPAKIHFDIPHVYNVGSLMKSNYQLGFLIAMFLINGKVEKEQVSIFGNKDNDENFKKLMKILKLTKVPYTFHSSFNMIKISDKVLRLFLQICSETRNMSSFLAKNKSFSLGVYDAIDKNLTHPCVINLYNWCLINLGKNVCNENMDADNDFVYGNVCALHDKKDFEDVWDIEVDCPSHSFIANNCIVHNSSSFSGVGYPQLSALLECAPVAHSLGGYIISNGGINHPKDLCKAFAAGADFVMLDSMLDGHLESPGELQLNPTDNNWYKTLHGYKPYRTSQGNTSYIKYKGTLHNTINKINEGLRVSCMYTSSMSLEELYKNSEFVYIS